ncbi:lipid kinase [Pelagibacterium sp. 26DY04]|uniref:lipid kinase n=1 Tax=Pelagibacterium sp. 26DY04 TaxID=2967130 RepID=UPI0028169E4C|nr:lipid kinase [Pelagibacterium sp. 26DY04]WMT87901.1 lipid kinase [Pelagibacterium sp. 26DY04]
MTEASPPKIRRALMLVNPNARRGSQAVEPIAKRLRFRGLDVTVERFKSPDELATDIARRRHEVDLAIVCGGDGTMNAAAPAIIETGLPMGIIPMGTANDLARTLHIPESFQQAADIIADGHTRAIDVGVVNGRPFFNVASIGLSAQLANKLSPDVKRRWGKLGYALTALQLVTTVRPFSAEIVSGDEVTKVKSLQIAVGNGRYYGGGTVVEADAKIDDGTLDLYSLETGDVLKLFLMLRAFRNGTHGTWTEVRTAKGDVFEIRTRRPQPVNLDGDLVTETPARFEIRPKAITVFVPPSYAYS